MEALLQLAATYAQFLSRSRGADWRRRLNLSVCVLLNGSAVLSVEYSSILLCRATVSLKECSTSSRSTQKFNGFLYIALNRPYVYRINSGVSCQLRFPLFHTLDGVVRGKECSIIACVGNFNASCGGSCTSPTETCQSGEKTHSGLCYC